MAAAPVYWSVFHHEDVELHLAASAAGLCLIAFPAESFAAVRQLADRHFPGTGLVRDDAQLLPYSLQIAEYFRGQRREFALPLDMRGTPFQVSVWKAMARIPYGEMRSYAEIADQLGNPQAARAVGAACGRNPVPIVVPCHRVIGKNGALTGFRGGLRFKERLLRLEGSGRYAFAGHARFRF